MIHVRVALACASLLLSACQERVRDDAPAPSASAAVNASSESDMVLVPAGSFSFGCDRQRDRKCNRDEQPATNIVLGAFRIDRTEVTQAAYQHCVRANRCLAPRAGFTPERTPRHAVTNVTWADASTYCAWRGARLPTEVEWEKAARGSDGRIFPWGDAPARCDLVDMTSCGRARAPVGSYPNGMSRYGALDMAGGVDEWVDDQYVADRAHPSKSQSAQRVARGGAYDEWHIRSTARSALDPAHHSDDLGFRCAH